MMLINKYFNFSKNKEKAQLPGKSAIQATNLIRYLDDDFALNI